LIVGEPVPAFKQPAGRCCFGFAASELALKCPARLAANQRSSQPTTERTRLHGGYSLCVLFVAANLLTGTATMASDAIRHGRRPSRRFAVFGAEFAGQGARWKGGHETWTQIAQRDGCLAPACAADGSVSNRSTRLLRRLEL